MNRFNNIFNKNEVENKLRDFKEGEDYKVTPVGNDKWFYDFLSDRLKNFWGDDRVVVNRVVETDSNKDYDYYGQFENYQDGSYRSFQSWSGKNYQNSESYRRSMQNSPFFRDPEAVSESLEFGRIGGLKPKRNVERFRSQHWVTCECGRRFDKDNDKHGTIENWKGQGGRDHFCSVDCAEKFSSGHPGEKVGKYPGKKVNNHSDLVKENQELRKELSEVKNQLVQVLDELKKLKRDINGKGSEKLEQQIIQNEKLIKEGEKVSVAEVQEQVNKSQALMKEFNISSTQDNKGNGSLPYVIGGSVILVSVGIVGYLMVKKNKRK